MSGGDGDVFQVTVEVIAAVPGAAERLLALHRDDGRGRCAVCTIGGQAGHQRWPCWMHNVGREAHARRVGGLSGAPGRRPRP